uniref:G-protein coupled receptors family 1 profile domain-containing protein n=1 Tax=Globodera rostochiensis TaxID=31243 RepID=A0A914I0J7_GLORO
MNSSTICTVSSSCIDIAQFLKQPLYQITSWVQLAIVLVILVSIFTLIRRWLVHKITIHGNLMILVFNLVFLYCLNAVFCGASIIRYKILFYFYSSNCDLRTPAWLAFVLTAPPYLYLAANPGIHFFIMAERCRATLFARHYENEGFRFGWICSAISWAFAFSFILYIILTDLSADGFSQPLGVVSLTSRNNAQGIIYLHYALLLLLIVTSIGDFWVKIMNQKQLNRSAKYGNYSVSKNYQMRENLLTIRLILPLDISYAIFFGIFLLIGLAIRFYRLQMSKGDYVAIYNSAITLLLLHSAVTLVIYNKYFKFASPKRKIIRVKPLKELTEDYFKQLQNQWK